MIAHFFRHLALFCILVPGYSGFAKPTGSTPLPGDNTIASYPAHGVVINIASDRTQATIHHQAIPGYMMEMTMEFPVKDTNELNGILPGDKITFTLVISNDDEWVENIHGAGKSSETNTMSPPMNMSGGIIPPELKPGDLLPDGVLTAEDGRQIHFSDFRGAALAFTFFFTRCPLPNFCPLMNRNFAAARDLILSRPNAPTNWEFLSISFDPQNDTPQVLASYGSFYRDGNPSHWLFAAAATNTLATLAPALDLMVVHQCSSISHNLRTVVLDAQGRIYRQFDGNQWTSRELADALLNAASQ
jgi:protein SCO1/2